MKKLKHMVLGIFAKKSKEILKIDKTLQKEEYPNYIDCYVAFNTNTDLEKDKDSQTIFIQDKVKFSKNYLNILEEFVKKISSDISVNPIDEEVDFWAIIKNKVVKKLTLEISPSNLFGHKNELVKESDYVKTKHKAKRYSQSIETDVDDGLDLNEPEQALKEGVEYCMKGGGSVLAIGKENKSIYNSKAKISIKTKEIEVENIDEKDVMPIIKEFLK
jgi:hypothetical protein